MRSVRNPLVWFVSVAAWSCGGAQPAPVAESPSTPARSDAAEAAPPAGRSTLAQRRERC
jgi:hypothetical protein